MKKILTLAFVLFCMVSAFADNVDIIIKTNSEKIEAIIQEVSDTEIKYKKANNPNGPLFIVNMAEVATILYANGEVQAIEHKAEPATQPMPYSGYAFNNGPLQQIGNDLYMIEGKRLNGKELQFFLKENCPPAYNYYHKWQKCENAGYALMGIGTAFVLGIGLGCFGWAAWSGEVYYGREYYRYRDTGLAFMAIGGGMVVASIPMIACGNVKKKHATDIFNNNCGRPQAFQPELRLQSGANGLGLALHF